MRLLKSARGQRRGRGLAPRLQLRLQRRRQRLPVSAGGKGVRVAGDGIQRRQAVGVVRQVAEYRRRRQQPAADRCLRGSETFQTLSGDKGGCGTLRQSLREAAGNRRGRQQPAADGRLRGGKSDAGSHDRLTGGFSGAVQQAGDVLACFEGMQGAAV